MSLIVLYFLHSTSVLSFYVDVVLTLSIRKYDIYTTRQTGQSHHSPWRKCSLLIHALFNWTRTRPRLEILVLIWFRTQRETLRLNQISCEQVHKLYMYLYQDVENVNFIKTAFIEYRICLYVLSMAFVVKSWIVNLYHKLSGVSIDFCHSLSTILDPAKRILGMVFCSHESIFGLKICP